MSINDIDDLLDEFEDTQEDAGVLANMVASGIIGFSDALKADNNEFLIELARLPSGFHKIPKSMLDEQMLYLGCCHLNSEPTLFGFSTPEEYYATAERHVQKRSMFLDSVHPEFVDKNLLTKAINAKSIFKYQEYYADHIDEEVFGLIVRSNMSSLIRKEACKNIPDEFLVRLLDDTPNFRIHLIGSLDRKDLLYAAIKKGFWPEVFFVPSLRLVTHSEPLPELVKVLMKVNGSPYHESMLQGLVLSHPIESVLPLFKTKSRLAKLKVLYTIDELRPHMDKHPHLRVMVLENDLGI
jgi:hypothetical protein